ncbi:hypothetical protein [Bradyrhizobium sp. CB3481]|uniref:hypothetical protein n=1 Tax=Bradyrhizobium sp. CB3481 TaxID=3039158 RepID=UPI0024B111FD|nr:hypothetical protein [Bradyrhizobium sp. CB3481]WFU16436.1 hypothetical protein QA643_36760 [Bradyrhizobium sp. CB3481]
MRTNKSTLFVFSLVLAASPAHAETAKEKCLKAAQAELALCQASLPPDIKPKDPTKPTNAEKEGMTKYTKASNECNEKSKNSALACH